MTDTRKGQSYTTGTVHYARPHVTRDGRKVWVQSCGMKRDQIAYLAPIDSSASVTCKRCRAKEL